MYNRSSACALYAVLDGCITRDAPFTGFCTRLSGGGHSNSSTRTRTRQVLDTRTVLLYVLYWAELLGIAVLLCILPQYSIVRAKRDCTAAEHVTRRSFRAAPAAAVSCLSG